MNAAIVVLLIYTLFYYVFFCFIFFDGKIKNKRELKLSFIPFYRTFACIPVLFGHLCKEISEIIATLKTRWNELE